jgi:predicted dehydrogenase
MPPGDWTFSSLPPLTTAEVAVYNQEDTPNDIPPGFLHEYDGFVNYYIHQVNLIRFLLGEPYHVTFADASRVIMCGQSDSGCSVVLEMAPFRMRQGWWEQALIGFERAFIEIALPAPLAEVSGTVRIVTDTGGQVTDQRPRLAPVSAMRQQAMSFLEVVQGASQPPCDAREAVEDLKIARALFQFYARTSEPTSYQT